MSRRFPVVKLADYRSRWSELEASPSPFTIVVMAHLHTRATRTMPQQRLHAKMNLIRHLYSRGYAREDVLELFRFLDWLLVLPADLEQQFQDDLRKRSQGVRPHNPLFIKLLHRDSFFMQKIINK